MAKKTTTAGKKSTAKKTTKSATKKVAPVKKTEEAKEKAPVILEGNAAEGINAGPGPTESAPSGNLPKEYKTLEEIVEQLKSCGYGTADKFHSLESNEAFIQLEKFAQKEKGLIEKIIKASEENKQKEILTLVYGIGDNLVKVEGSIEAEFEHFMSNQNAVVVACSDGTLLGAAFGLNSKWELVVMKAGIAFKELLTEKEVLMPVPPHTNVAVFDRELDWMVLSTMNGSKLVANKTKANNAKAKG